MQHTPRKRLKRIWWVLAAVALLVVLIAVDLISSPSRVRARQREVAEFKRAALIDLRNSEPYAGLTDPILVREAAPEFLDDQDYVLGVVVNGSARAYPTRIVSWHHAVNDRVGETRFAVTFCSVCNTGICFNREVDGRTLTLDFLGLYQGSSALYDRETETIWGQVSGEALKGVLAGKTMARLPLLDTTWKDWKRLHPDTLVMAPHPKHAAGYLSRNTKLPRWFRGFPEQAFARSLVDRDPRLPPFEPILGVAAGASRGCEGQEERRAYPLRRLRESGGAVNDLLGGAPIAVLMEVRSETVNAVSRSLDGRVFTFKSRQRAGGPAEFVDVETGTRWTIEGVAVDGPLAGKRLAPVTANLSQWYGWSAYFPKTSIFGE